MERMRLASGYCPTLHCAWCIRYQSILCMGRFHMVNMRTPSIVLTACRLRFGTIERERFLCYCLKPIGVVNADSTISLVDIIVRVGDSKLLTFKEFCNLYQAIPNGFPPFLCNELRFEIARPSNWRVPSMSSPIRPMQSPTQLVQSPVSVPMHIGSVQSPVPMMPYYANLVRPSTSFANPHYVQPSSLVAKNTVTTVAVTSSVMSTGVVSGPSTSANSAANVPTSEAFLSELKKRVTFNPVVTMASSMDASDDLVIDAPLNLDDIEPIYEEIEANNDLVRCENGSKMKKVIRKCILKRKKHNKE